MLDMLVFCFKIMIVEVGECILFVLFECIVNFVRKVLYKLGVDIKE